MPAAMAVTESDEVLVASTQSARTIFSKSANKLRFTSKRSTMASMMKSQSAKSCWDWAATRRLFCVAACSAVSLPLATSLSHCSEIAATALLIASGCVSKSLTIEPACAAICAMPRPIAPVPTKPTVLNTEECCVMCVFVLGGDYRVAA